MGEVGRRWRRILHDEAVFGGPGEQKMFSVPAGQMYSVAVGGPGLVAVGRDLSEFASVVWVSADGLEWQRHFVGRTFNESQMRSVAVGGPGLVAVGSDGRDFRRAAVWVSSDAFDWQRVPHRDEAAVWDSAAAIDSWLDPWLPHEGVVMHSVVAGEPGLVAVGDDEPEDAPAVWVSADGFDWQRLPHNPRIWKYAEMRAVVVGGQGLVAVGWDEGGPAVWVSP